MVYLRVWSIKKDSTQTFHLSLIGVKYEEDNDQQEKYMIKI